MKAHLREADIVETAGGCYLFGGEGGNVNWRHCRPVPADRTALEADVPDPHGLRRRPGDKGGRKQVPRATPDDPLEPRADLRPAGDQDRKQDDREDRNADDQTKHPSSRCDVRPETAFLSWSPGVQAVATASIPRTIMPSSSGLPLGWSQGSERAQNFHKIAVGATLWFDHRRFVHDQAMVSAYERASASRG